MASAFVLHQIDAYEVQFKTQPSIDMIKQWLKDSKSQETNNIVNAYKQSTIDQCKDLSKLFGENDLKITDEEMDLITNDAQSFFEKNFAQ